MDQIFNHPLAEGERLGVVGQVYVTKPFGPGDALMYGEVIERHDAKIYRRAIQETVQN